MKPSFSKPKTLIVIWQAIMFTPASTHIARISGIAATPLSLNSFFISPVARALKPGAAIIAMGIGQLMAWKPVGPKGIFIDPPQVTLEPRVVGEHLAVAEPEGLVGDMPTSQPM